MGKVKRYEVVDCACGRVGNEFEPDDTGGWVLYDDHVQAMTQALELAKLANSIDPFRQAETRILAQRFLEEYGDKPNTKEANHG